MAYEILTNAKKFIDLANFLWYFIIKGEQK